MMRHGIQKAVYEAGRLEAVEQEYAPDCNFVACFAILVSQTGIMARQPSRGKEMRSYDRMNYEPHE